VNAHILCINSYTNLVNSLHIRLLIFKFVNLFFFLWEFYLFSFFIIINLFHRSSRNITMGNQRNCFTSLRRCIFNCSMSSRSNIRRYYRYLLNIKYALRFAVSSPICIGILCIKRVLTTNRRVSLIFFLFLNYFNSQPYSCYYIFNII
jgi:hypothetical protein